ncbi:unnamed protein product [Tenebrio molitor]|nr:unnamed protein product [Tenebrio molitor]
MSWNKTEGFPHSVDDYPEYYAFLNDAIENDAHTDAKHMEEENTEDKEAKVEDQVMMMMMMMGTQVIQMTKTVKAQTVV